MRHHRLHLSLLVSLYFLAACRSTPPEGDSNTDSNSTKTSPNTPPGQSKGNGGSTPGTPKGTNKGASSNGMTKQPPANPTPQFTTITLDKKQIKALKQKIGRSKVEGAHKEFPVLWEKISNRWSSNSNWKAPTSLSTMDNLSQALEKKQQFSGDLLSSIHEIRENLRNNKDAYVHENGEKGKRSSRISKKSYKSLLAYLTAIEGFLNSPS